MELRRVFWAAVLGLCACGGGGDGRSDHGYVGFRAFAAGDTLYLGGDFREPRNAAGNQLLGHQMVVVLDATDPAAPAFVAELDLKLTRVSGVIDGQLVAVQDGFDEEMLDLDVGPPAQPARLKLFDLADPAAPALARTIELPVSGRNVVAWVLDDQNVLVTAEGFAASWIVRPGAAAGAEVVGTADVECQAHALDGATLWCVGGLGLGTGEVVGFTLGGDGSLTELARASVAELILPRAAVMTAPGGSLVVADRNAGAFSLTADGNGVPAAIAANADLDGAETGGATLASDRAILQTDAALHVIDPASLQVLSTANLPGAGDSDHLGGTSVERIDGGPLDGLYAAALGDFGVALLRSSGDMLDVVGGYYRHFGTDLISRDDLVEGHY